MFSKLSAVLFATSVAALPAASSAPYTWSVHGYSSTCTAATCRYTFNVSSPVGPNNQPAFDASGCYGTSVQGGFVACSTVYLEGGISGSVQAQEYNYGRDIGAIISVQYSFSQNNIQYTYTGNQSVAHTQDSPAIEFEIVPLEVHAVPVEACN